MTGRYVQGRRHERLIFSGICIFALRRRSDRATFSVAENKFIRMLSRHWRAHRIMALACCFALEEHFQKSSALSSCARSQNASPIVVLVDGCQYHAIPLLKWAQSRLSWGWAK